MEMFFYGSTITIYNLIKLNKRIIFFLCVVWSFGFYYFLSIIFLQITNSSDYIFMHTCVLHWASFQRVLFLSQTFNIGNVHQDECQAGQLTCQMWKNEYSLTTSQVEEEEHIYISLPLQSKGYGQIWAHMKQVEKWISKKSPKCCRKEGKLFTEI